MHSKRLISRLQSIGKIPPKQKRDAHDLLTLFHAMPGAIRESLALNSQEHSFERYRYLFTSSRYQYEWASWDFSDPVLMRLLRWALASVDGYYKERSAVIKTECRLQIWPTNAPAAQYECTHNVYYVK